MSGPMTSTTPARADLRSRIAFFLRHAGYSTPPGRYASAVRLAKAEIWAQETGIEFLVQDDDQRAYCYCDDASCPYHEGSEYERTQGWETVGVVAVRPCGEHGTDCSHAEVLGSLWGIMEPSAEYLRVVKAELAYEAQP